jgi:hypothetical protein
LKGQKSSKSWTTVLDGILFGMKIPRNWVKMNPAACSVAHCLCHRPSRPLQQH